ncbi:MAG TPA: 3-hydroxyacyl-CoA dehydrogenase NAD-binding domain-containing protein, partial [Anaerolineales bacterium]|nr:3-hydroxyacyl-CoA dehydrogenase NAD-binding domain-containing protein [Anaerolineales bacterium]
MTIKHIFVIGSGTMGNGIAQVAATSGYDVTCMDVMPAALEKARAAIAKSTTRLLEKGTLTADQKAGADKIAFVSSYDSLPTADFVIEAATENPELKFKIFKDLDSSARGDVILASNTSSISITKIAAATKRPDKVIGMHFMNPVPLMKLVEVIKGLGTSEETLATTLELCRVMGKEAWAANDSPGFISNRILCPM